MKLSVLVTFYNQEQYVDQALASIISQNVGFRYEVLIGDDSSSDNTLKKIMEWKNKYPEMFSVFSMPREKNIKYNAGVRASQNRLNLLKKVLGEYFIFLDGDDYYIDEYKFQKQVEILDNPNNKDCIGCAHNMEIRNEATSQVDFVNSFELKEQKYSQRKYWRWNYFHPNSLMYRSSRIVDVLAMNLDDYFNDNLITYSFLQYGSIYYLPDIMAVYRLTANGIWTGRKEVVGIIRNLIAYDIEIKINPKLKNQSFMRHRSEFQYLYKHIKEMNIPDLEEYYDLAIAANAVTTLCFLRFESLGFIKKNYTRYIYFKSKIFSLTYYAINVKTYFKILLKSIKVKTKYL